MRPQDFYTETRASKGVRVELIDPAGNREWMHIRSLLSSEFRLAVSQSFAGALRDGQAIEDRATRKRQRRQRRAMLAASLVGETSLPHDQAGLVDLLVSNPRLRRQIELIAENSALHFGVAHD